MNHLIQTNESSINDSDVVTATGKLGMRIPLYQIKSPHSISFNLDLEYQSHMLKSQYETWAEENNTGVIATGWALTSDMRIAQMSIEPSIIWLKYYGDLYQLKEIGSETGAIYYATETHSNLNITYYTEQDYWIVTGIDGNLYYFGKNDTNTNESGTYSPATGTYTNASAAYTAVREIIANVHSGVPSNPSADNTKSDTREVTVTWDNGWIGPSTNVSKQQQRTTSWNLSHVEDVFGNILAFSYIQHVSNVCEHENTLTYCVASYLYRLRLIVRGEEAEALTFAYSLKDTSEYSIYLTLYDRPNGMQQRFEKLKLDTISHYIGGSITDVTKFSTTLTIPTAGGSKLSKRQLTAIEFLHGTDLSAQYQPGYLFEYYGEMDNVKVGSAGFDESHPYHKADNGALYGHLKAVTYPSGKKKSYEYTALSLSNINRVMEIALEAEEPEPAVIHTPYDYSIIIRKNGTRHIIGVCTWTSTGWEYQELASAEAQSDYDHQKYLSYSYSIIGFINPDLSRFHVYSRNVGGEGIWSAEPFDNTLASYNVHGPEAKKAIAVGEKGVAISSLLSDQAESDIGVVWFFYTDDKGLSFHLKQDQTLQQLTSGVTDYYVALKVINGMCHVFVLTTGMDQIRPSTWHPSSWLKQYPDIYHYSMSIGTMDSITPGMTISHLGKVPLLMHKHAWESATAWYNGLVCIGGKITRALQVENVGQIYSVKVHTRLQWAQYWFSNWQLDEGESGDALWGIDLICHNNGRTFSFMSPGTNIEERMVDIEPGEFGNMQIMTFSSNTSGNGSIYQYYYSYRLDISTLHEIYGTLYASYDGDTVSIQSDTATKNLACIMKDDVFAVFETAESTTSTTRKTYKYYDQRTKQWGNINTGTLSQHSTTYNSGAATALKVLEYLGMALFIVLLPLGLGSMTGIMLTVMSLAMMVSSYVAQAIYENSIRTSLNPACSFMGNRFINDGTTIWHRGSTQNTLTAVGAGTAAQPYDILSDSSIVGSVAVDKQMYGVVYDYVPFHTDSNRVYFRRLKNNAVGNPCAIGGLSGGCDDLYADGEKLYAYSGKYKYVFNSHAEYESKSLISSEHPFFTNIDACTLLNNSIGGEGKKLITVSGTMCCLTYNGITSPPEEIASVFRGSGLTFVDAALEKSSTQFYLFSGNNYELITMSEGGFDVVETGAIGQYSSELGMERIEAACVWSTERYFFTGNSYVKLNSADVVVETGKLGSTRFYETFDKSTSMLQFIHSTLSAYKAGRSLLLHKYGDGNLNGPWRDYVVAKVRVYDGASDNSVHDHIYGYDTQNAVLIEGINSALYQRTFVEIS